MVHLRSEEEKDDILSKLWRLKYTRSTNEKISITHDYTVEERALIREMVDEAKRRNLSGNTDGKQDFLWKVRGTPKTRMQIVKIGINRSKDQRHDKDNESTHELLIEALEGLRG